LNFWGKTLSFSLKLLFISELTKKKNWRNNFAWSRGIPIVPHNLMIYNSVIILLTLNICSKVIESLILAACGSRFSLQNETFHYFQMACFINSPLKRLLCVMFNFSKYDRLFLLKSTFFTFLFNNYVFRHLVSRFPLD
jgi:hypothetical protein